MDNYVVGIDLGATKIALGLIDSQNQIIAQHRIPTDVDRGPQIATERIGSSMAELEQAALPVGGKIVSVGICSPGPLDHETGTLIDPPNLTGWRNVPLRKMLNDSLNLPVTLEHDAKAAALGEFHYGAGQGRQSMVYIVAGTGVGAAIIIDGQLYRGLHNFAGEVGGMTIDRDGEPCTSGIRGCVQGYLRGPALARRYQYLKGDAPAITGEQVAHLAEQGDEQALQVMTQAGEALGITVASLAMILDIELYVIGGSVIKAGDLLFAPARQAMPKYCFESVASTVEIVPVGLGDDGPLLGCAWLARRVINHT